MKLATVLSNFILVQAGADNFKDRFELDISWDIDQVLQHNTSWNSIKTSGAWINEPPTTISAKGSTTISSAFDFDNKDDPRIVVTYVDEAKPHSTNKLQFFLRVYKSEFNEDTIHVTCPEYYRCDLEVLEVNRQNLSAYARMNVSMREADDKDTTFPAGFAAPEVVINPPALGKHLNYKGRSGEIGYLRYVPMTSDASVKNYQYLVPCGVSMPALEERFYSNDHVVGFQPTVSTGGVWNVKTVNYSRGRTIKFNEELSDHERINSEGNPIPLWVFDIETAPIVNIDLSTKFDNSSIINELSELPTYTVGHVSAVAFSHEWNDEELSSSSSGYVDVNEDGSIVTYDSQFNSDITRRLRATANYKFTNGDEVTIGVIANNDEETPCQVSLITENLSLKYRPIVSIDDNQPLSCQTKVHWVLDESFSGRSGHISYVEPPMGGEDETGQDLAEVDCIA